MSSSWIRSLSSQKRKFGYGLLHNPLKSSSNSVPQFCIQRHRDLTRIRSFFTISSFSRIGIPSLGRVHGRPISVFHLCILQAARELCTLHDVEPSDTDSCNDASTHLEGSNIDSDGNVATKEARVKYEKPIDFTKVKKNLLPTVILVGRPNVGKSALFNRLIHRREALVYNTPDDHVTRDFRDGIAKLGDVRFRVLDSAGLETAASSGSILDRTAGMTASILARSQFAVFLIDVRAGLHPLDLEVGRWLRKNAPGINIVVVMNKSESLFDGSGSLAAAAAEAYKLGWGDPIAISAETGLGMQDLYVSLKPMLEDYMLDVLNNEQNTDEGNFSDESSCEVEDSKLPLQLAIVGKPNVGKSTLLNTLLQEERVLVGPEAGWLQRTKMEKGPSSLSIVQSRKSLMRAHVVALVLDAEEISKARRSLKHDEVVIARQAIEEGRGLVVIVNKMDLLKEQEICDKVMEAVPQEIQTVIPQVTGIPVVFISALEGRGQAAVMHQVIDTYEKWCTRLSTARLNRWLRKVMSRHSWKDQSAQPKVKYFTQVKARPPTFVAFVSGKKELPDTEVRFLKRSLKEDFDLGGIPIRIMQRNVPRKAANANNKSSSLMPDRIFSDKRTVSA
ncbi:hypothetical protein ACLB2K_028981 [Fragaria x ananassa]